MNYDRVRQNLRSTNHLNLILVEIPKKLTNEHYPAIVERDINKVLENHFDPIPWKNFEGAELVMWYPPIKLPIYNPEEFLEDERF